MRFRKQAPAPARAHPEAARPTKPAWQEHLDPLERPNREDRAADHNVFADSILEPVPLPRWLRGRRRAQRDKLSYPGARSEVACAGVSLIGGRPLATR